MAKCWTPLPLLCAFVTLLIEWRVFERIKILLLGESFNRNPDVSDSLTRGGTFWDGRHNGLGERGKPDH